MIAVSLAASFLPTSPAKTRSGLSERIEASALPPLVLVQEDGAKQRSGPICPARSTVPPRKQFILDALEDPPDGLAELRGVLMNEHQWRQSEGLDPFPE